MSETRLLAGLEWDYYPSDYVRGEAYGIVLRVLCVETVGWIGIVEDNKTGEELQGTGFFADPEPAATALIALAVLHAETLLALAGRVAS